MTYLRYHLAFYTLFLFCGFQNIALADDENADNNSVTITQETVVNPMYTMGCIPEVALPVYPESRNCVAGYPLSTDFTDNELQTESTNTTTVTTNGTASGSQSTAPAYPQYYYYPPAYPYYYQPGPNPAAVFATGLLVGGLWGAAYYNNYHTTYYTNTYYWNQWSGNNGNNAGYIHGNNGGAYHWNYNDYSGGGYCYQGNCAHNNNWNGNTNNVNTTTTTNTLTNTQQPVSNRQQIRNQEVQTHPQQMYRNNIQRTSPHEINREREYIRRR